MINSSNVCVEIEEADPIAPFVVMDSPQGQQLERLTDKYCSMTSTELEAVEYEDIKQDYLSNRRSTIMEKIQMEKKFGNCQCTDKNPKGK